MKFAFLGDIALIGKYNVSTNPKIFTMLEPLAKKLAEYDYVVANLESPFSSMNKSRIPKSMHLKADELNVDILKYLRINAVTLANNHINDFGNNGIKKTIKILEDNNIEWFGLYGKVLTIKKGNQTFSLSGFACLSTNPTGYMMASKKVNILSYDNLIKQLQEDKNENRVSILSLHWGMEHTNYPNYEHIQLINKLTKSYDFIAHGHHPHVIQGLAKIRNSHIAFSLGNCIFDDIVSLNKKKVVKQNEENKLSFIYELEIYNGDLKRSISSYTSIRDSDLGFEINEDISDLMVKLNHGIDSILDIQGYNKNRIAQFNKIINQKFGKRNFSWLFKRLNYNAIGTFFMGYINLKKYKKIAKKFY
jgi:poly-gamma-glutamate synthesis protein (capsule biosynthesis protein)